MIWHPHSGGTLSGNGTISCPDLSEYGPGFFPDWEFVVESNGTSVTIESGVTLRNVDLYAYGDAELVCKNTFHNASIDGEKIDLTHAKFSGYTDFEMGSGAVYTRPTFEVGWASGIYVFRESERLGGVGPYVKPVMNGNVVMNGSGGFGSGELVMDLKAVDAGAYSNYTSATVIDFCREERSHDYGTLVITGSLTFNGVTAAVFSVDGEYEETSPGMYTCKTDYDMPSDTECLIICESVHNLQNLKPYTSRLDLWEYSNENTDEYDEGGNFYYKSLDEYAFYAVTGGDGLVYIYLGKGGTGAGSPIPEGAIQIGAGETVVLGGTEETTPGADAPVYIQGGTADATGLGNDALNNQIIMGSGGTLITSGSQVMSLSGNSNVKYSIVGAQPQAAGADILVGAAGSKGNVTLSGSRYDTAKVTVQGGVLTISKDTKLGLGAAATQVELMKGTSLTNYGTVAGSVTTAAESTLLNQGTIAGDIELAEKAVLTNNATITGTLNAKGAVHGSGVFADTVLASTASLHVGNSPGYQKHTSLTIDRGATLSFSVDGPMAATATTNGSGTYSVLETGTLTINPGTETVNVNVDVTLGIVAAGSEPLSLKLIDAATTNAKEEDFTLKLSDESKLLEEGATLSFNATEGTLVLNAAVSKAALAALMDSNSANVANTMWASANAVQEMARTAEHQFLVGMPGQTTFWGAGMGSFMDVGGKQGFTSNAGGYAVGLQHAFTQSFRAGVALGQSFGDFKSDDNQLRVDQMALMPTLTAQYVTPLTKSSSLSIAGHIAYGVVENEADTYQAGTVGKAEWDDQVLNIGVRAAWNSDLTDNTTVSIFTGLTYQNVDQDSFTEKFTGGERDYHSGSMSSLSIPVGVTLRGIYQMEGTNIFAPELTLAYIGDVTRDNPEVKTSVYGFNREGKGTNIGRSAFMLNAGANWMFDSTWSLGAFYTLEARSNQLNQSVNAALRCCF